MAAAKTQRHCPICRAPRVDDAALCALCNQARVSGFDEDMVQAGIRDGLEGLMRRQAALDKPRGTFAAAADDSLVAGKCALVNTDRGGFVRCLRPATRQTADGDPCCEACWERRGGR